MVLRDLMTTLRRRWALVAATTFLCVGVVAVVDLSTEKQYQATAQIFVSLSATDAGELASSNTFAASRVQSYTAIATTVSVTGPVVKELGLDLTPQALGRKVTATAPTGRVLIMLSVTDPSPAVAAQLTNAVAQQLAKTVGQLEETGTGTVVRLTVTEPAYPPRAAVSPRPQRDLPLALLVGIVLGVVFAIVRQTLENTVKSAADLARISGLPVLGTIPFDRRAVLQPVALRDDLHSSRSEAYRQLRTNLQFVKIDDPPRVIAVTSAVPGEGKSSASVNLASALAASGQRVCLVEADMRKPTVAKLLGLVPDVGLTTVLIGAARLEDVLQNAGEGLAVLTSGTIPPNPSELLTSEHFGDVLEELSAAVDVVVIDTAPLLPVADGAQVAARVDATLLVVRSGRTKRETIRRAIETLDNIGVRPIGAVLSMTPTRGSEGYYSYYGTPPAQRTNPPAAPTDSWFPTADGPGGGTRHAEDRPALVATE